MLTALMSIVAAGLAAGPPAMGSVAIVRAGREVFIGGTQVLDMMIIAPGEVLDNRGRNFALVLAGGTSLRVMGQSRVRYNLDFAELLSGQVSVTTTSGFQLRAGCYSVSPAAAVNTEFDVVPYQGRTYIHARAGDVDISAKRTLHVPGGKTAAITGCGTAAEKIEVVGSNTQAAKILFGAAAPAAVAMPWVVGDCVSAEGPKRCNK